MPTFEAAGVGGRSRRTPVRAGGPMKRTRNFYVGVSLVTVVGVLAGVQFLLQTKASAQGTQAAVYDVDRMWPKPLPNHWILGSTVGLSVDSRDHVWIVHRGKATIDPKFGS